MGLSMNKKIKVISLIIPILAFTWFFFFWESKDTAEYRYTIQNNREDGCEIYQTLGDLAQSRGDYAKALRHYYKALTYLPENIRALDKIGSLHERHNNPEEALKIYFKAMSIHPYFDQVRYTHDKTIIDKKTITIEKGKQWEGEDLSSKTIFVYCERGFRHTLSLCRFLPLLKAKGAHVIFSCQKSIVPLLQEANLGAEIIDQSVDPESLNFDFYTSLQRLPHLLEITLDDISSNQYLQAPKEKTQRFKKKLFNTEKLKVGIVWRGNPNILHDKQRSLSLLYFHPLAHLATIQLYSLQIGSGIQELQKHSKNLSIKDLSPYIKTWHDTAALVANLDLLICVDTAIAHLGGALGKQTWVLLPYVADWRWLGLSSHVSNIWYSSVLTFRQPNEGDWDSVIRQIKTKLTAL